MLTTLKSLSKIQIAAQIATLKLKKCTLSLTKIKRNEKTKSGATSKTKFALIILIFIHKLSFKKDKKQQRFIKIY